MCEESNTPVILYSERVGGGDDTEGNIPNGILVTLSYWQSNANWMAPSHYLLHKQVMVNRDICVDELEIIRNKGIGYPDRAELFRKAIALMDQLKELNQDLVMEATS